MTNSSTPVRDHGTGSLSGIRVVDLSRVLAGPLCTQMFADHGADVIKVEPPRGDETRTWGPPFLAPDRSAYFNAVNRNKSNVCIDLRTPQGQHILSGLLERADVLVENFKAGTLAKWGLPDEVLRERYPGLIHCRITGFGIDGPMGGMPGYDAVVQAYSGLMSVNGESDGPALRIGVPVVDMVTASYAFAGALLALHERTRTGLGQLVDCTLLDTAVSLLHPHSSAYLADHRPPRRTGSAHPTIAPYDTFAAANGPIFIGAGNDSQFARLAAVLGVTGEIDERFATNTARLANIDSLRQILADAIASHDRGALAKTLLAEGVPASALHDIPDALQDPQVRHREMVTMLGDEAVIGVPIKLSRTPAVLRTAARDRGADTRRVLTDLGYSDQQIEDLLDGGTVHEASAVNAARSSVL